MSATAFGTSSPRMMCRQLMIANAINVATEWVAIVARTPGRPRNQPSMRRASAGSPIQPSPREASVMPSWVAEMERASD